jgi:hypothetical protein
MDESGFQMEKIGLDGADIGVDDIGHWYVK